MKSRLSVTICMLAILGVAFASLAISQDKKTTEQDAAMAEMMKYAMPDQHHQALEPMVGKWEFVSKFWMDPKAPAQESRGTSEATMILGGRYVQENVTGDMMGGIFHGLSWTGYDLMKKEYLNIWMDDMSTAPMVSRGQMDAAGKMLTFIGTYPDPMKDLKDQKYKTVVKIISPDQHVMEMYMVNDDGTEFKHMEITYNRVK